ncbi:MAG: hypothetical protein J6R23_03290 [Spirochaetales bacterium]|nr:hypothetical protein [Spirochaetales bacterium]
MSALFAQDNNNQKTTRTVEWFQNLPEKEGPFSISIDGEEIPAELVFVSNNDFEYSVVWSWDLPDSPDGFSYRLNGGEWNTVEGEERSVVTNSLELDKFNLFEIYATKNGVDTDISTHGIIAKKDNRYNYPGSLRLSLAPYTLTIYDFYNGHHIPSAKYLTYSKYGLNVDSDFGFYFFNRLRLSLGTGYSLILKRESVIPNAFDVHYVKAYSGLDIAAIKRGSFSASVGAFGGIMMHINAKRYNISSYFGARLDFSYALNNHIVLSAGTKFSAAHLPSSEPLMNSISYFIDPVVISAEVRF